jgi:hypothetical protein
MSIKEIKERIIIINRCAMLSGFSLLFLFLIQGCVANLPAVRDFSQTTVMATSSFNNIADDLPKSCIRRVELSFPPDEKITVKGCSSVEYSTEYENALSKCDGLKNSLDGIIMVNNVLRGYAEALGKLASDEPVTFTEQTSALESSVKRININGKNPFDGPRATAVTGLAKFLFNAAVMGYRQKILEETIRIGHEPLKQIIGGLRDVAGDYQAILRNEKQNVVTVQNILIAQKKMTENELKLGDAEIDEKLYQTKQMIELIEAKDKAAEDYKIILEKIAGAHEQLYVSTNDLNSALLIAEIGKYSGELIPLVNNITEAFSK